MLCSCGKIKYEENLSFNKNTFNYKEKVNIKDIVTYDDNIDIKDEIIDTKELGNYKIRIDYTQNDEKKYQFFEYVVVDTEKPIIWLSNSITRTTGYDEDIAKEILCIDNEDRNPKCEIVGEYNVNKAGTYNLVFKATDKSGNIESKDFSLIIKDTIPKSNNKPTYTYIENVLKTYKNDNNMIGIDVSKYQGDIDWQKVKESGIEFAIIRLGYQYYFNEELSLDPYFIQNINGAIENDIKVGIYFYSYALNDIDAENQANFVIDNIKDYKITMPIAFDWENFSHINEISLNLYDLRSISNTFLKTIEKAGYYPVHYGSKNYLKTFWLPLEYDTWLAHYIDKTNYDEKYVMWQICNDGIVPGIDGYVDIDIYFN